MELIIYYFIRILEKSYKFIKENFKFINISTDEVFGECDVLNPFDESSNIIPNSHIQHQKHLLII